jgi:hypothetical protein
MISEEFVPDWDVYRDDKGRSVTITVDQAHSRPEHVSPSRVP